MVSRAMSIGAHASPPILLQSVVALIPAFVRNQPLLVAG